MVGDDVKDKIVEFAKTRPIELVYLFGSQATGNAGPASDYDFAVLFMDTASSLGRSEMKLELINLLCQSLRTDMVDVVDLNSAPLKISV